MKIIYFILLALVVSFIVIFVRYVLAKEMEYYKRFQIVADELRKVFHQAIVHLSDPEILNAKFRDDCMIKSQQAAFLNLRQFFKGKKLDAFDRAWNNYYDSCHYRWEIDREEILKNIEEIIKFTKFELPLNPVERWRVIRKKHSPIS